MRVHAVLLCVALVSCQKPSPQPDAEKQSPKPSPQPTAATAPAPPEPEIAYPFQAAGRTVFASGYAGENLRWQAGLSACKGKTCPINVWLVEGETILASQPVAWAASSASIRREEPDPGWGAGDPMGNAANVKVWASGEEEQYVGTIIRPVKLGEVTGILVDQLRGFEHLRRHHELFAVQGRKLSQVWQGEEGAGPAWSATAIISLPDSTEAVVYYSGFRYPTPSGPDSLEITQLRWTQGGLRQRPEDAPKQVIAAGAFPSAAAAQRARDAARDCLGAFWVLPASRLPNRAGQFSLVLPGATAERVNTRLEAVRKCAYNQDVQVLILQ